MANVVIIGDIYTYISGLGEMILGYDCQKEAERMDDEPCRVL